MKKIMFLIGALMATVGQLNAKTTETTLWDDTYSDGVELNSETVGTMKAGDVLRVYVTVPEGGANFKIVYKGAANGWTETTIPSIDNQWPWVNGGETYKDFTLTAADITALTGMNIYIYKGDYSTIDKVSLLTEEADDPQEEGTATELWSGTNAFGDWGDFESLRYDGKGELANAKVGDDIRVTFTNATEGWQVYVCDAASYEEFTDGYFDGSAQEEAQTVNFHIANATVLEAIQERGIVVKGKLATLTKIELVTYTTSYDAVAVTIGVDGIATFSSSKHLDFAGTGVTPYYASGVATGTVTLTSTTTTWSWQGYIMKGSEGTYTVPVTEEANASYPQDNYLQQQVGEGTVAASTDGAFHYIFAKTETGTPSFYKLISDHTLGAKKAYLETVTDIVPSSNARVAVVFDDDETTGIENEEPRMKNEESWGAVYDLQGRRVINAQKGLYIQRSAEGRLQGKNGKKVVIK